MNMFARFDENQCMAYNSISIKHYIKSHLELQREITLRFDENQRMAYNSISIKHYIKSHLELQREITLIELAPSPYFFL